MTSSFKKLNANDDTDGFDKQDNRHFAMSSTSSSVAFLRELEDLMIAPQVRAVPTIESTFPFSSTLWNSFLTISTMVEIFGGSIEEFNNPVSAV